MAHPSTLLAAAYDRALAATDADGVVAPAAHRFAHWLAARWSGHGPPAPTWPPDAVSVDGRGQVAMRWYTLGAVVLGYAPGTRGCYVVPVAELSPVAPAGDVAP
jgi:hypothetical protein